LTLGNLPIPSAESRLFSTSSRMVVYRLLPGCTIQQIIINKRLCCKHIHACVPRAAQRARYQSQLCSCYLQRTLQDSFGAEYYYPSFPFPATFCRYKVNLTCSCGDRTSVTISLGQTVPTRPWNTKPCWLNSLKRRLPAQVCVCVGVAPS
jgi:hypothetical protein